MKVLYFHQHFTTPDGSGGTRSYEFAKYCLKKGIEVTIVCGKYDNGKSGLNTSFIKGMRIGKVEGIKIIEFDIPYSNKDSFTSRSFKFLLYSLRSLKLVFKEEYDIIFCTSTPLTAAVPGIFAKLFRKKSFIFEVRDLWPQLPVAMGVIKNPLIIFFLSILERSAYRHSDALIGLSPGIVKGIEDNLKYKKNVKLIPNGCDLDMFKNEDSIWSHNAVIKGDFIALYAGTHGKANGLLSILDAARILKEKNIQNIKIILVGEGSEKLKLIEISRQYELNNVIFLDSVSKKVLGSIFNRANLGLQTLLNLEEFYYGTSPNKFFDYLSAGLPVLTNYPGWIADMILDYNLGYVAEPDDPLDFAQRIIEASEDSSISSKSKNSFTLASEEFNREKLAKEFYQLIKDTYEAKN